MSLALTLRRLWHHETVWRFVDALAPRGFGFLVHTWLIWRFGPESYALAAWTITTFGLMNSFIPDPSGYVLLASTTARAKRRIRLFTPWLWGKTLLGVSVTLTIAFLFAGPLVDAAPPGVATWTLAGSTAFAVAETLWAACGTNRFATGHLIAWAGWGVVLRIGALSAALALDALTEAGIGEMLLVLSMPLLFACILALPLPRVGRRSLVAGLITLKRYSLWTQANGFLLMLMAQAPVFFAGTSPTLAPAATGQLAYMVRVLNLIVQPLMILQSVIVRDYARLKAVTSGFRFYRLIYRGAGLLMIAATALFAWLAPSIAPTLWLIGLGLALFTSFRFEFALLNALRDVRFLSLHVFLPVTLIFVFIALPLHESVLGVATATAAGHAVLTVLLILQARQRIVTEWKNI